MDFPLLICPVGFLSPSNTPAFTNSSGKKFHWLIIHCVKNTLIFAFAANWYYNLISSSYCLEKYKEKKMFPVYIHIFSSFFLHFHSIVSFPGWWILNYLVSMTSTESVFVHPCNPCIFSAFSMSFWNRTETTHTVFNLQKGTVLCSGLFCFSLLIIPLAWYLLHSFTATGLGADIFIKRTCFNPKVTFWSQLTSHCFPTF